MKEFKRFRVMVAWGLTRCRMREREESKMVEGAFTEMKNVAGRGDIFGAMGSA